MKLYRFIQFPNKSLLKLSVTIAARQTFSLPQVLVASMLKNCKQNKKRFRGKKDQLRNPFRWHERKPSKIKKKKKKQKKNVTINLPSTNKVSFDGWRQNRN